jgi:imidazolonepropionase-like amidohydrolase
MIAIVNGKVLTITQGVLERGILPAEIIGVADRIGSLEVGKDADIVVLSGHPFDYRSVVELVWVNGELAYQREA